MDAEPSLDYSALLKIYDQARKLTLPLSNEMVALLEKDELEQAGKRLGIMRGGIFVFGSEAEMDVVMDFAIRRVCSDGQNASERFLREPNRRLSVEEAAALQRMAASRYRILDIGRIEPGVGLMVTDRLRRESGFLVDRNLSMSAREGQTMAGYVVEWEKFWMTTGAGLPMLESIWLRLERPIFKRFGKPGPKHCNLDRWQETDLAAWCIRACLEAGVGQRVLHV